ncbi:putative LPS assembly protein LptD [uncultured Fibrella sp.]|uniref:putative LPS assembly protein LptD n=1 Tax=uncultured Fibrella sp. TaxID=1284596 RepID=UPI0035CC2D04
MIEPKITYIILRVTYYTLLLWLLTAVSGILHAQDRPTNPLSPLPVPPSKPVTTSPSGTSATGTSRTPGTRITGITGSDTTRLRLSKDTTKTPEDQFATTVRYSSKDSSQVNGQIVELWGNAEVVYGDISLKADYIKLNQATNEVFARGRYDSTSKKEVGTPIFKDRSEEYNTKEIRYNFKTKKALVQGIVTQQGEGNIRGKIVKKDAEDNLYIRGSIYTTCNLAVPHFHINAPKLKVVHNKQVVSGPFNLVINQIPLPLGLPFGFFPFPKKKDIGVSGILMPQYGEEPNGRGFYLRDGGYYWAVNENIGLQFTGQIYSRGSWGLGTSGAYNKRYRYAGNFQLRYNRNISGELIDTLNQARTDFAISWSHAPQNIGRRGSFSANVNVTSNSYNQFNSFQTSAVTSNVAGSSIQYSRTFGKYVRSGANVRVNQQFGQVNRQTGVRENGKTDVGADFNLSVNQIAPFALKGGTGKWYESFRVGFQFDAQAQISNTIRSQLDTSGLGFTVLPPAGVILKSRDEIVRDSIARATLIRLGQSVADPNLIAFNFANLSRILDNRNVTMRYSIPVSLPNFKIARYINFTPGFSLQGDIYSRQLTYTYDPVKDGVRIDTARGFFPTYSFATNASLNTRVYGTYFFRGKRLEAIRHTVAPSVSISYTPDFSGSSFGFFTTLPNTGTLAGLPEYRRTLSRYRGLGGTYGSSAPGQNAVISFGIVNQLEMKVRSRDDTSGSEFKKIPLFDNISINGSYNLLAPEYKLSPINISANTQIFKNVNFNLSGTMDPYAYRKYYNSYYNPYLTPYADQFTGYYPGVGAIIGQESSVTYPRVNRYSVFAGQGLGRLTSLQAFVSTRFAPKKADAPKKSPNASDATLKAINQNPDLYVDFNIPWTINVSYSFGYTRLTPTQSAIIQTLNLTGDFSLTPKWKFTYQTGYDFQFHAPSLTTIGVNRDLHCWEMAFNWTPYAGSASRAGNYSFDLRAKSSILQELKLSRRRSFFDNGGFGGGYR